VCMWGFWAKRELGGQAAELGQRTGVNNCQKKKSHHHLRPTYMLLSALTGGDVDQYEVQAKEKVPGTVHIGGRLE
jgi:hypothetical protein